MILTDTAYCHKENYDIFSAFLQILPATTAFSPTQSLCQDKKTFRRTGVRFLGPCTAGTVSPNKKVNPKFVVI